MKRTLATIFTIMLLLLQLPVQGATITGNYGDKNLLERIELKLFSPIFHAHKIRM